MPARPHDLATFAASPRSILGTLCPIATVLSGLALLALVGCDSASPPALPGDDPLTCTGALEQRTLRVDRLDLPFDSTTADQLGADQDGDGTTDNMAGNVLAAVSQAYADVRQDTPARIQRRIDGDTVWLIQIAQCDGRAHVTLSRGEVVDAGTVRITPDDTFPGAGTVINGHLDARDGIGVLPLGAIADLGDIDLTLWDRAFPARLQLDLATGEASGTISGGIAPDYASVIALGFLPYLQARLDGGDTMWGREVDTDHDGVITLDELHADTLFQTLMYADLDVGGDALDPPSVPPQDGHNESLSFGFGVHAVDVDVVE